MMDYLANRQAVDLSTDRSELNAKLDALVRNLGLEWLEAEDGQNPLQVLWRRRDQLATNELLNLGDAVGGFEVVDATWLKDQLTHIKSGDDGRLAGAIFELLGLNFFLAGGATVAPSANSNPGYDGIVDLLGASLVVSIKNHGMSSHEKFFRKNAKQLDENFKIWAEKNKISCQLRIGAACHLDPSNWTKLKQDVNAILSSRVDGSNNNYHTQGEWQIVLKSIANEFEPLGQRNSSSIFFMMAPPHKNEQNKFLEDLRKGCANIVKHTKELSSEACRILFVRLGANASINNCSDWARDYFTEYPDEKVGLIMLYQSVVTTGQNKSALSHFILPIIGPQFESWSKSGPSGRRTLPTMSVLVGTISQEPSKKIMQADNVEISLDDFYSYQRGDIYRLYKSNGGVLDANLSNPAPGIKVHAECEMPNGTIEIFKMVVPEDGELALLP